MNGVASPVETIRDRVRDAAARGTSLRITGAGTWLDAGRPVSSVDTLPVNEYSGILEYIPGDLTLTAAAGTTLGEIRQATAQHGQWLALDPAGSDEGTLGATVATASCGALATHFGAPRDLVLGVEFVTGGGAVARGGGRVVKNVAGFDLTRLVTGSWGSLGAITEATVRLHARPQADVTLAIPLDGNGERVVDLLRRTVFRLYSLQFVNDPSARALTGVPGPTTLVRVAGNPEAVAAQRQALGELGPATEVDPSVWERLRALEPPNAIVFRLSHLPSQLPRTWAEANAIAGACEGTLLHATPSRGVVRCIVPNTEANVGWLRRAFEAPTMCKRAGERMPESLWPFCTPSPLASPLMGDVKAAFDPSHVLNPGIFGELA